jgi:putative inorganic carbon (HCO3(-)) transporter
MADRFVFGYGTTGRSGEAPSLRGTGEPPRPAVRARAHREQQDWAYLGLLAFTALLYFRPQDIFPPLVILHLPEVAAIFALGSMILGRLQRGLPISRVTPELVGVIALGAVILLTAPLSVWMGGSVNTFVDLYAKVVLIFILMINTLTSPRRIERLTWILVIASGWIATRSVVDYVRGVNLVEYGRVVGSVGGMFRNPNDLALNMVVALPLCVAFLLRPVSKFQKLIAVGCAVAMLGAIVASRSRSGTVGLAVMAIVLAWQLLRRRPALVVAGAMAAMLALPLLPSAYLDRMASITDGSRDDTGSRAARSTLFAEAWEAFIQDPLTGVGAGQFVNYDPEGREQAWRETHNVVLQVAAELGIFGLLAFLYLLVRGAKAPGQVRRLLRLASNGPTGPRRVSEEEHTMLEVHAIVMLASLAGWFACAFFASVAYNWTLYYMLGLAVAARELLADRLAANRAPSRSRAAARALAVGVRA